MTNFKPNDRVRVTITESPKGTWTGTVRATLKRPMWPSGSDVVVDLDDLESWREATRFLPGRWHNATFRTDELELLD